MASPARFHAGQASVERSRSRAAGRPGGVPCRRRDPADPCGAFATLRGSMGTSTKRLILSAAALCAALVLLAGCGGSSSDDADPQQLLSETFSGEGQVESGVLDISVDASADGDGGGSLTAALTGPFESSSPEELPLLDLDASVDLEAGPPRRRSRAA